MTHLHHRLWRQLPTCLVEGPRKTDCFRRPCPVSRRAKTDAWPCESKAKRARSAEPQRAPLQPAEPGLLRLVRESFLLHVLELSLQGRETCFVLPYPDGSLQSGRAAERANFKRQKNRWRLNCCSKWIKTFSAFFAILHWFEVDKFGFPVLATTN